MTQTRERLQEFLDYMGVTAYRLEKENIVTRGYWGKCINPTAEIIEKIVDYFPELSAEYILRGEQPMLRTNNGVIIGTNSGNANNNVNTNTNNTQSQTAHNLHNGHGNIIENNGAATNPSSPDEIASLKERIEELKADKADLREQVKTLQMVIQAYNR